MASDALSRGDAFRKRLHEQYDLGPAEVELVEEAARALDVLDIVDELVRAAPTPENLKEARLQRAAVKDLLTALRIPEEEAHRAESRSDQARRAARARWDRSAG